MNTEEFNKAKEAMRLIMEAIRKLSEAVPRHPDNPGFPHMRVTSAWLLLDEACKQLGLQEKGRPT